MNEERQEEIRSAAAAALNEITSRRKGRALTDLYYTVDHAFDRNDEWKGIVVTVKQGVITGDEAYDFIRLAEGLDLKPAWEHRGQTEYKRMVFLYEARKDDRERDYPFKDDYRRRGDHDVYDDTDRNERKDKKSGRKRNA